MKNLVFFLQVVLLFSCSKIPPPKEFIEGKSEFNKGEYIKALNLFVKVKSEEKLYVDSAQSFILQSFDSMTSKMQWSNYLNAIKVDSLNQIQKDYSKSSLRKSLFKLNEQKKWMIVFNSIDSLESIKSDLVFLDSVRWEAENQAILGTWQIINYSNNEITFKREKEFIQGYCTKDISGDWEENMLIYKDVIYAKNCEWDVHPILFSFDVWSQSTGSYYSKNSGSLEFKDENNIQLNYETELNGSQNVFNLIRIE